MNSFMIGNSNIDYKAVNIKNIFVNTIHKMDDIEQNYNYIFHRLCYHSKGRHSFIILHQRAYELTLKLLEKTKPFYT